MAIFQITTFKGYFIWWKSHMERTFVLHKYGNMTIFISIKQVKNVLPKNCLNIFILFAYSFWSIIWNPSLGQQLNLLCSKLLQKRAICWINNANYNSHTDSLFRESQVMKLKDLLHYQAALFAFDFKANNLPISFSDTFKLNRDMPHCHITRQSDRLYVTKCHSLFADRLPLFLLLRLWNKWIMVIPYEGPYWGQGEDSLGYLGPSIFHLYMFVMYYILKLYLFCGNWK